MNPQWQKAVHEAGHAVAGLLLQIDVLCLSLRPSISPRGVPIGAFTDIDFQKLRGESSPDSSKRRVTQLYAGASAEAHFTGEDLAAVSKRQNDDMEGVEKWLCKLKCEGFDDSVVEACKKEAIEEAKHLVNQEWSVIEAIAKEACQKQVLTGPEIRKIAHSINPDKFQMIMKQALFKGKDYITTQEWTLAEIETLLEVASDLKRKFKNRVPHRYLPDKTIFLLFFDKSTRTRNSFEAGITQLGGHAHFLTADVMQVSHGESPKDTGIILSSYGHGIAIRHDLIPGEGNKYIREVARWANAPVINMQCDVDHPCQTLADLMTIRERLGKNLRGRKLAVTWAYAPSYAKPLSVPQGLIMLMPRFGLDVVLANPPEYGLMPETLEAARENASAAGVKFEVVDSMDEAFRDADIVIPKSWGCLDTMGTKPEESLRIAKQYRQWICDAAKMELTQSDCLYMHPLPADRGNEVTDEVIDGPHSVVFTEAENRLHTAKAIMALTMADESVTYEAEE